MKILIAPDSFKGSLSASDVAKHMEEGILKFISKVDIMKVPMADGGEGTVDAIVDCVDGKKVKVNVKDPLGREIQAFFGIINNDTAIVEMAVASGLQLLKDEERNPMVTTSYGTGELIKAALDHKCKNIIIGIGGSATNDGGVGMCQALGINFLDINGEEIGFGGGELSKIRDIDISKIDPRIRDTSFTIASDVKNVLCGPEGASAVYGPQKGATPEMVEILDKNLRQLAKVIEEIFQLDILDMPGTGAAGGLGAALTVFLNAKYIAGIDVVMELTQFDEKVKACEVIITGEGSTDYQTIFGKVPYGVAKAARKYGKPVICISGALQEGYENLYNEGITALFSIADRPMPLKESMERSGELLEKTTENVMRLYVEGRELMTKGI